jgi:hypothetical protein
MQALVLGAWLDDVGGYFVSELACAQVVCER